MHDEHPHPLLAQVPLTVSPFLNLPSATTLPYTYKSLPSTLPASVLDTQTAAGNDPASLPSTQPSVPKPSYVMSAGGHSAHPDDIIANCHALQAHLNKLEDDAREMVREWDERLQARDLAEKRRKAPGFLDSGVQMLVPERRGVLEPPGEAGRPDGATEAMQGVKGTSQEQQSAQAQAISREGEEIDRAFGGLEIR